MTQSLSWSRWVSQPKESECKNAKWPRWTVTKHERYCSWNIRWYQARHMPRWTSVHLAVWPLLTNWTKPNESSYGCCLLSQCVRERHVLWAAGDGQDLRGVRSPVTEIRPLCSSAGSGGDRLLVHGQQRLRLVVTLRGHHQQLLHGLCHPVCKT